MLYEELARELARDTVTPENRLVYNTRSLALVRASPVSLDALALLLSSCHSQGKKSNLPETCLCHVACKIVV